MANNNDRRTPTPSTHVRGIEAPVAPERRDPWSEDRDVTRATRAPSIEALNPAAERLLRECAAFVEETE